jgi:hypothetical protein
VCLADWANATCCRPQPLDTMLAYKLILDYKMLDFFTDVDPSMLSSALLILKHTLDVDLVLPDLLLRTGRVVTDSKEVAHLVDTGEEDLAGHEEPDTLSAGRRRETA